MSMTGQAGRWGLTRYVIAATLARTADGGGVVAVVLLVTTSGGSGWTAGLLGACLTLPHMAGPFVARSLDVARDGRTVLAAACVGKAGVRHGRRLGMDDELHHRPLAQRLQRRLPGRGGVCTEGEGRVEDGQ